MWRAAQQADDEAIVAMSVGLYEEDPAPGGFSPEQTRRTLARLRAEPVRGRAVVLELGSEPVGYAILISFWSNELGGEICNIDELYVRREHRGQGQAGALLEALAASRELWPGDPVALDLEVSPKNRRARALYERSGFVAAPNTVMRRRLRGPHG